MLAIKCIYACYQTKFCLLSNEVFSSYIMTLQFACCCALHWFSILQMPDIYPSISDSSSHLISFSSRASFISGSRLLFSVSSSIERVPLHKASSISFCSCSSLAMSFSNCSNSHFSLYVFFLRCSPTNSRFSFFSVSTSFLSFCVSFGLSDSHIVYSCQGSLLSRPRH